MKTNFKQRLLSGLLAFVMILGMMPAITLPVHAADRFVDNDKINLNIPEVVLTEGRPVKDKYISIVYTSETPELLEKYPVGTDVSKWFTNLPGCVAAYIGDYSSFNGRYPTNSDDEYKVYTVRIYFAGIPDDAAPYYKYELEVPASFYTDGQAKTFKGNTNVEELGSACSGCTLKTINGMKVCYKEGSGIHVCELNFGDDKNDIGSEYDKNPENGYISAEEEPSRMTDYSSYWYFFDIEEVSKLLVASSFGFYNLSCFPNLRTVEISNSHAVVKFGENNTKLESINVNCRTVTGLDKIPSSAPLQKIEIKYATVDRYNYNFPMLEKLVLTDSVIDGEADDQIFITKDCAALKHIDLSGTDISHNGSDTNISLDLANLEYLDVSETGIQKVNIAHYSKLKYFYAKDNGLTEIIGARGEGGRTLADKCPELLEVDISGNYYISQFDIGEHQKIRKLNISNNDFVNLSLNNLPSLKELYAGYNDDLQALYLMNNPALEKLDLCCAGTEDFAIAMGDSGLPGLKYLDISYSDIVVNTDTAAFWAKMPSLETLDISYADSVYVNFLDSGLPNLKELIADGYYYDQFYVGALPKLEKIVSNESYAKTVTIKAPKLKTLEIKESDVEQLVFEGTTVLEKMDIQDNAKLTSLELNDCKALTIINAYGCNALAGIDFTDCWSIHMVRVSRDVNTVWPSGEGMPFDFEGWGYLKDLDSSKKINNGLKANAEEISSVNIFQACAYNTANWKTDNGTCCVYFSTAIVSNEGLKVPKPYAVVYNLSPYKETSHEEYTYYATEVLSGDHKGIELPGLVGWATKKFATEAEIAYRPGDMIYLTEGKDLELWPVYNIQTSVYYNAGNYSEDIGWNIEADEVDGLEEFRSYEYKHTVYGKSSLYDYWTYDILDLVPTREGYIFKGWQYSTANSVNIYQPGDEIDVVGDKSVSLSAKWEKAVEMPSAYTYLSCDKDYFKKGDTVTLTAKVVGLNGVDLSETRFNAFLYLYEEGKENEKTKVAERTFTGDEVDLTFAYPADDTRIAYVEIFTYTGGNYSQKSITDDYKLTPAKAMDVEFKYSIGDGYVTVTEDTTIVLQQGANDGWLDIEVDAIWGKGELDIRLYEIYSNVTVGTDIDNVVSTNTIGTKTYSARVSDETGNSIYTKNLTVKIVPPLEITGESEDTLTTAMKQDVVFTVDYKGYVGSDGEYLDELYIKEWDSEQNKYIDVPGSEIVVNHTSSTNSGTIAFVIPVTAPASVNYEHHTYYVYIEDMFGNDYEHDVSVTFDRTNPLTFAADGRGTLKFYDYYGNGEYSNVFANETDVAAVLDGGWVYDIMDKLYKDDRENRPDNVLVPTVGDGVEVLVRLLRYESYEAYKAGGTSVNVYEQELGGEYDSSGYKDISDLFDADDEYIPGTIDLLWADVMTPGYYVMSLDITNTSAVGMYDENYCFDIPGFEWWIASGTFEILAEGQEHVHNYTLSYAYNGPQTHTYKCFCGDSYEEDHVFSTDYPIDGLWNSDRFSYYDENGKIAYADSNVEERWCTICANSVYRWRFLESFAIGNADLQEGKTYDYEKMMDVDQTLDIIAKLDFLEEFDPRTSENSYYTNTLGGRMADFYPVNTKVNWTSSNQDVATVDENGVVTAVGEGTALITATTVQPMKSTDEPATVTIHISVDCQHAKHMVKVPAKDPTCQADGHVEHYMCLDCTKYSLTGDFTDTVSYENDIKLAKVDHAKLYGVWHADANGHWRECKYECGTKFDEGTHYSNESANCQHPEYCAVCDYVLAPVTDHSHDTYGWSDGYHWSICECGVVVEGSNKVHQFGADGSAKVCDKCRFEKSVGYTVSGTITSYLKGEGDITVQLLAADETVAYSTVVNTYSGTSTFTSTYSIPEVTDGTYTLRVSKANHVTRDYEVTVNAADFTQDMKIHLLGDVTGDGKINSLDKKKIYNHINGDALTGYEFDVANVRSSKLEFDKGA